MTTNAARRFQWAMGHTLFQHEGACAHLHGHNYVAIVEVTSQQGTLDSVGRVVDFSVIKDEVGNYIDSSLDHRFIVYASDPRSDALTAVDDTVQKWPFNPTAENIAQRLYDVTEDRMEPYFLKPVSVTVWETENVYAKYQR